MQAQKKWRVASFILNNQKTLKDMEDKAGPNPRYQDDK